MTGLMWASGLCGIRAERAIALVGEPCIHDSGIPDDLACCVLGVCVDETCIDRGRSGEECGPERWCEILVCCNDGGVCLDRTVLGGVEVGGSYGHASCGSELYCTGDERGCDRYVEAGGVCGDNLYCLSPDDCYIAEDATHGICWTIRQDDLPQCNDGDSR